MERVRPVFTRKRIVWLTVVVVIFLLMVEAFVRPPAHEVHMPGDIAVKATLVVSSPPAYNYPLLLPTQSLEAIRCHLWRSRVRPVTTTATCPDSAALAGMFFPSLTQSPKTLYFPWPRCPGTWTGWDGFNLEYRSSSRTLVLHCYLAAPWIWRQPMRSDAIAEQPAAILVIPTESFLIGTVNIVEDDRIEHLVGDWSTEYPLATATIS
jgi:hypothetical protein